MITTVNNFIALINSYNSLIQSGPIFYYLGPKVVFPLNPRAKKPLVAHIF
jgi:hypothetical protein